MQKPHEPATYADLLALPDHVVGEIIDGELIVSPRPASRHAGAAFALAWGLGGFGGAPGGPGGWVILPEPELHFGADTLVPDLAGWRRERLPELPDAPYLTLAPDWICEILSPSTARHDRAGKLAIYRREGVRFAWLVDPAAQTLEVLLAADPGWHVVAVHAGAIKVRAAPFDAIEVDLGSLWAR